MEFVFYSATVLIAFSGLLVGAVLSFISPEEMAAGQRYFPLLQKVILLALLVFFINSLGLQLWMRLIIYILAIAYSLGRTDALIVYPSLAILLFFSSFNQNAFFTISALIFIYGLPSGSLYATTAEGDVISIFVRIICKNSFFLLIALVLPFIHEILF